MSDTAQPLLLTTHFDHITLIVADLEATRNFYLRLLGLTEVPRPGFDFAGAWFQSGQVQIHVTVSDERSGQPGWGDRQVTSISRGHHFAFGVADFQNTVSVLAREGISIADGPKVRPDGVEQLYIYDPDGHLVELFQVK